MTNLINAERERESKPGRDIAYCIDANYAKGTNTTEKSRRQLVMEVHTIAYSKSHRDNGLVQARGKIDDEANTLSTGDGCTNQSTGNYVFTKGEDMTEEQEERILKLASVDNQSRKGHIANGTVPDVEIDVEEGKCIATRHLGRNGGLVSDISSTVQVAETPHVTVKELDMSDIKFVGGVNPKKTWNKDDNRNLSRNYSQGERIHHPDGIIPCISSNMGGTANGSTLITENDMSEIDIMNQPCKYDTEAVLNTDGVSQTLRAYKGGTSGPTCLIDQTESVSNIRIRKLTPVECERLQGYKDGHTAFGRLPDGKVYEMSNTQRYKMCGNGISSPVPAYLFPKIFGTEHIRVMSLFSGCGGTELLLPSNFEVVGHCEFDKHASAVLNYHYPNIPNFHDVTQFVDKEVPEFDLLVGGFPCQSWSIAGLRKGYTDDRGQLIFNVYDIIRKHKPKFICLENVKGLLSHSKGDAFEAIMEYLSSLGYDLDFEVVNSKNFGLAQNRERVFIMGKLK